MKSNFDPFERRVHLQFSSAGIELKSPGEWKEVLRAAGVEILSTMRRGQSSAHVLSESSLFVSPQEVIVITCGNSNIICAIEKLLEAGVPVLQSLMYECRHPFRMGKADRFASDIEQLQACLPDAFDIVVNHEQAACSFFTAHRVGVPRSLSFTTRLLMLNPSRAPDASQSKGALLNILSEILGDTLIDDWHFQPDGYSANFLAPQASACMHYSPGNSSYLSFEVSAPSAQTALVATSVLRLFTPQKIWRVDSSIDGINSAPTSHLGIF